jgi:hypothetical protein
LLRHINVLHATVFHRAETLIGEQNDKISRSR